MNIKEIFWDIKMPEKKIQKILSGGTHQRFIHFAAILLSRTNDTKAVFVTFFDKTIFVKHWQKIKRRMRKNRWNDSRIAFWGTVYAALRTQPEFEAIKPDREKKEIISEELKLIAKKIRNARDKKKLTQKELGKQIGLSQQTISFVENGYNNISFNTLKKITEALGMKIYIDVQEPLPHGVYTVTSSTTI